MQFFYIVVKMIKHIQRYTDVIHNINVFLYVELLFSIFFIKQTKALTNIIIQKIPNKINKYKNDTSMTPPFN